MNYLTHFTNQKKVSNSTIKQLLLIVLYYNFFQYQIENTMMSQNLPLHKTWLKTPRFNSRYITSFPCIINSLSLSYNSSSKVCPQSINITTIRYNSNRRFSTKVSSSYLLNPLLKDLLNNQILVSFYLIHYLELKRNFNVIAYYNFVNSFNNASQITWSTFNNLNFSRTLLDKTHSKFFLINHHITNL